MSDVRRPRRPLLARSLVLTRARARGRHVNGGVLLVVGTADTKGSELHYVAEVIRERGLNPVVIDVGTTPHESPPGAVPPDEVATHHPDGAGAVRSDDRGVAVAAMAVALDAYVRSRSDVSGIIGIGGSGGTALITPAMQSLPVGVPKVMVSTVASGNVAPYVGAADIAMMYSITDVAGLNRISRVVLGNAANAVAGMAASPVPPSAADLPAAGLTMFGVTTPLVTRLVEALAGRYDPLVFHATGTGGRSMEKLVGSGLITAVLDMTTTEVADLLVGGVFPAGQDRLDVVAQTGVPYVGSCGALDMVNFGARPTVPERFSDAPVPRAQPGGDVDAHDPGGERRHRGVHRRQAQRLRRSGPLPPARGWCVRARRTGTGVLGPGGRRRLVRHDRGAGRADGRPPRRAVCPQHHGSRVRRSGHGRIRRGDGAMSRRAAILERFAGMIERRIPIVGGGAGTGLSAKWEEAGGIDLIVIYNSGRYRMAGRGSLAGLLAYGNANEIVVDMAREVLPVVKHTPVLAGVNGTDPFYLPAVFLGELRDLGFAGVQNFPTVGLIDGVFRQNLEETGMGYGLEVEMIAAARELDLLTTPYVFSADDAAAMTEAGADIIVCHLGLTTGGSIGAETAKSLDDCVTLIDEWTAAARQVRDDVIVLCHGGPIAEPADAEYVLRRADRLHGFYGASSMERLPVEQALKAQTEAFKAVTFS